VRLDDRTTNEQEKTEPALRNLGAGTPTTAPPALRRRCGPIDLHPDPVMSAPTPTFRYPRSSELLALLLEAMGHGGKAWPGRRISVSTFKRIAEGEPTAGSIEDFIDEALGLLGSPSGRWDFGPATATVFTRVQVFKRLCDAARAYDLAVSHLNASAIHGAADPRHALPVLTILAVRLGTFIGVAAAARGEDLDAFWQRTLLDSGAFGRAITRYAEQALPDTSWTERYAQSGLSKNTLDNWRRHPPSAHLKFTSLQKFAAWAGNRIAGTNEQQIAWHLRWLAAGARLLEKLQVFLGRDADDRPWIDRLRDTARYHAEINFVVSRDMVGYEADARLLDPAERATLRPDEDRAVRGLLAWIVGRSSTPDGSDGVELSEDELTRLHVRVGEDASLRQAIWSRLGGLHALGLYSGGYLTGVAAHLPASAVEPYMVHHKDLAAYLKLQHDLIAARLAIPDQTLVDDEIAAMLGLVFDPERAAVFERRQFRRLHELLCDPTLGPAVLPVAERIQNLRRALAGLPVPDAAPAILDPALPLEVRDAIASIDIQRSLPALYDRGAEVIPELAALAKAHPNLPEPALVLLVKMLEEMLRQDRECRKLALQIAEQFARVDSSVGPATYPVYRKLLALRRRARSIHSTVQEILDTCLKGIANLASTVDDRWPLDLAYHVFAGQRAALGTSPATRERDSWTAALQACLPPIAALYAERPDHPEPCLWLARFHKHLGDPGEARRWARRAAHLGDLTALTELDAAPRR